ncbi:MAG TPA: adenylate/guanylate cyclase domain-containing protein [Acidimicrobiia bacterium]|nr:adenylate/guanylate cyclase domain-containing protein [Acidimicrobiia bacterium]
MTDNGDALAGLVDDTAPDADAQRTLASFLFERGVPFGTLRDACAAGSMSSLVAGAVLWSDVARLTLTELSDRVGLSQDETRRVRRMLGFADPGDGARYPAREVEMIGAFAAGTALFGDDRTAQISRVFATSTSAIAEAAISLFTGAVGAPMRAAGATDAEYGLTLRDAMFAFDQVCIAVDVMLRLNFERGVARLGHDEIVDALTFAIAFVDVVDSTAMAGGLASGQVAAALREFDQIVAQAAVRHDVRLVKLIGDAAMLAARDVGPLSVAVAEIVRSVADHPLLRGARAGVSFGEVAAHDGDYFGQVVNLAARAATVAAANEVLVDAEAAKHLGSDVEPAGTRELKGFPRPVVFYRLTGTATG